MPGTAAPSHADDEKTFDELQERIRKTVDFLRSLNKDQFAEAAGRAVTFKAQGKEVTVKGAQYLASVGLPNFYFHVTTAYGLLRHNGVEIGKAMGAITVADNTFASPWVQQPLALGFDLVMHSATKYLNGHSDIIGGVVVSSRDDLSEKLTFLQNAVGGVASPFDSFLALRGLKTLHLRMAAHCENALFLAEMLESHPGVEQVIESGPGGAARLLDGAD